MKITLHEIKIASHKKNWGWPHVSMFAMQDPHTNSNVLMSSCEFPKFLCLVTSYLYRETEHNIKVLAG